MNKFIFNNKTLKGRRKELRAKQTEAEEKLWLFLRNKEFHGLKFFRQYGVSGYILDFYCPKIRLGIELDGSQHIEKETMLYDKDRERILQASNIKIIRFWNSEVMNNTEVMLEKIRLEINNLTLPNPPLI
ncbi:MAG: endonuclease domain-containing protein [Candidatus Zambryskibacteria bacterium]